MKTSSAMERRNRRLLGVLSCVVIGMASLSYLSVPLYQWFCQVTGWSGTPGRYSAENHDIITQPFVADGRTFTLRFDANTNPGLAWDFTPIQPMMEEIVPAQQYLASYRATNLSDKVTRGSATFNVTPLKFGVYFVKIACFCFSEQTLQPGESVEMPVSFTIDPAIFDDPELDDVRTITLSYTFFPADLTE